MAWRTETRVYRRRGIAVLFNASVARRVYSLVLACESQRDTGLDLFWIGDVRFHDIPG